MAVDFQSQVKGSCYSSPRMLWALILLTAIAGIVYTLFEYLSTDVITDGIFTSMLIGATMILVYGMNSLYRFIRNSSMNFFIYVASTSPAEDTFARFNQLCNSVLHTRNMSLTGFVYGCVIGSAPFLLGVWNDNMLLKILLTVFMFFVNYCTGLAFYSLIAFFLNAVRLGKLVKVDLWHPGNPSTDFLLNSTRQIAVLASVYISLCLSSVAFSRLPISELVILYAIFAGLIFLATIFIPIYPIVQKMSEAKAKALSDIQENLQGAFQHILNGMKENQSLDEIPKLEKLIQLRDKVESVQVWPFRLKSIGAALSVIFFSSIPVILQVFLERIP